MRNFLVLSDIFGVNYVVSLVFVGVLFFMSLLFVMVLSLLVFAGGMAGLILLKMLVKIY